MTKRYSYLDDKGFVEVIEITGSDTSIAMAARASYDSSEYEDEPRNKLLIDYLVRKRHTSPLEMASIQFRLKIPIFVMRQHVRHRTASLNEMSLRYIVHDGDYWVPQPEDVRKQSLDNKQGSQGNVPELDAKQFSDTLTERSNTAWSDYNYFISLGVAKEQARCLLPVNFYTTCVWKLDIHNLLHYMKLRTDPHAQEEIVKLAEIISQVVKENFPLTYKAWETHVKNSITFSSDELDLLREMLSEEIPESGTLRSSRLKEFKEKINKIKSLV
jgi:thymidylate synthase (FAD)